MIVLPHSHFITLRFSMKGWENVLFKLRSERVNIGRNLGCSYARARFGPCSNWRNFHLVSPDFCAILHNTHNTWFGLSSQAYAASEWRETPGHTRRSAKRFWPRHASSMYVLLLVHHTEVRTALLARSLARLSPSWRTGCFVPTKLRLEADFSLKCFSFSLACSCAVKVLFNGRGSSRTIEMWKRSSVPDQQKANLYFRPCKIMTVPFAEG